MDESYNKKDIILLTTPVLQYRKLDDDAIWTGCPDTKYIEFFLKNEEKETEISNLMKKLEEDLRACRSNVDINKNDELREKITDDRKKLYRFFDSDDIIVNSFIVCLLKTYQDFKNNKSDEIDKIDKKIKKVLDNLEGKVEKGEINGTVACSKYNKNENKYYAIGLFTKREEKKIKNDNNRECFRKFCDQIKKETNCYDDLEGEELEKTIIKDLSLFKIENLEILFDESSPLGKIVTEVAKANCILSITDINNEDLTEEKLDEKYKELNLYKNDKESYNDVMTDTIYTYMDYIKLDNLILSFIIKQTWIMEDVSKTIIDNKDGNLKWKKSLFEISGKDLCEDMKKIKAILESARLCGAIKNKSNMRTINDDNTNGIYDENRLNSELDKFSGTLYMSPEYKEIYRGLLYADDKGIWDEEDFFKNFKLSDDEKKIFAFSSKDRTLKLLDEGVIDKKFLLDTLEELNNGKSLKINKKIEEMSFIDSDKDKLKEINKLLDKRTFIKNMYDEHVFNEEDLKSFYKKEYLYLEDLDDIIENKDDKNNMAKILSDDEMINLYEQYGGAYLEYKKDPSDINEKKLNDVKLELNRNFLLFKHYKLDLLNGEQKKDFANKILYDFYYNMEMDKKDENNTVDVDNKTVFLASIEQMYEDSLIDFDTLCDYANDPVFMDFFVDLFENGRLMFNELSSLKNIFTYEDRFTFVDRIFNDIPGKENRDQKYSLVMEMFNDNKEEDMEAKNIFLIDLGFSPIDTKKIGNKEANKKEVEEKENNTVKTNKFAYVDTLKWDFFKLIDPGGMRCQSYSNGFVVINLPRYDKKVVEKLQTVTKKGIKDNYGYGYATYIINNEKYMENENLFVETKDKGTLKESKYINDENIRKMMDCKVDHKTHDSENNWMRNCLKVLGIDEWDEEKSKLSKEEYDELMKFVNDNVKERDSLDEDR